MLRMILILNPAPRSTVLQLITVVLDLLSNRSTVWEQCSTSSLAVYKVVGVSASDAVHCRTDAGSSAKECYVNSMLLQYVYVRSAISAVSLYSDLSIVILWGRIWLGACFQATDQPRSSIETLPWSATEQFYCFFYRLLGHGCCVCHPGTCLQLVPIQILIQAPPHVTMSGPHSCLCQLADRRRLRAVSSTWRLTTRQRPRTATIMRPILLSLVRLAADWASCSRWPRDR